jgi:hypothetical protein
MTHKLLAYCTIFFLATCLYSCGKSADKPGEAGAKTDTEMKTDAAAVPGTIKETAVFKMLVPDGWDHSVFNDGTIQAYNKSGTFMVEAKKAGMNMTEKDVETLLASMAKQYNGTPLETVEFLGMKFFKTSYTAFSKQQTMYNGLKDGAKISITLMGPDHLKDPTIQAVFQSIVLK